MPRPGSLKEVAAALPGTVVQLVPKTGLVESTIRRTLHKLRKNGLAHIGRRIRKGGGAAPFWVAGPGVDAPPLAPYTNAQYSRNFRKRVRKAIAAAEAGALPDERYARRIARHQANKVAKVGDPLINMLFGR